MLSDQPVRASACVAPLEIPQHQTQNDGNETAQQASQQPSNVYLQSHMTPPATPNGSQEDLSPELGGPPVFHSFLRAFYPFSPSNAMAESSVTLPLEEGDVVLVHSVHTNGWADGTLLASGARGWLPTNYCDAYEPDDIRSLLKALLNFWDLLRSTSVDDNEIFRNQEFMKGIIAGVRFLLERTNCLSRESPLIVRSEQLRKSRKSILSELSMLVKTAKRLQECQKGTLDPPEDVNDIIDEMILKAFKIVTKGVRFVDYLEDDRRNRTPAAVTVMATVTEEALIPPTPPAEHAMFNGNGNDNQVKGHDHQRTESVDSTSPGGAPASEEDGVSPTTVTPAPWGRRLSSLSAAVHATSPVHPSPHPSNAQHRLSQGSLHSANRLSSAMAHRLSLAGPSPLSRPHHLASERLNRSHDKFLSHLGSFIGRLHLQSHSRPELAFAVKLSATSGGELLAVIDGVCGFNSTSFNALGPVRVSMFERIQILVVSACEILGHPATEDGSDIIMPHDNNTLLLAATGCVRAAGECVAKAKAAVERVGDFEFELGDSTLGIDLSILDTVMRERGRAASISERSEAHSVPETTHIIEQMVPAPRRRTCGDVDKPLPRVPKLSIPSEQHSPDSSRPPSAHDDTVSSAGSSFSSNRTPLRSPPEVSSATCAAEQIPGYDLSRSDHDIQASSFDIIAASSAGSTTTYLSRDSEVSMVSQTSTRATTPDHMLAPRSKPSMSELSTAGSFTQGDEADDVETRLLERTFAHELMFNKEGQVTGGSLPALVERLTTHESTPDAAFVSTFYLTFRLFCTPVKLTETLIDRFDYVGESPHMAGPVRLRVYNAFKGWLESHWRDQTDRVALQYIIPFAEEKLRAVIPSVGRRLLELAKRVSGDGPLVPRLVSSMGKTNTAIAQYVPADTPLPQPILSKGQLQMLHAFKAGGNAPTLLDFDPLEVARQLTIKQMGIFCSILPEELLASQWMKNGGAEAPHVKAMSSLTTDLSNLVAETILHHPEIKKRAAVIKQWIKVAHHLLELHNYDGLMAVICSLNSSTISRLRKTWDAISPKRKELLRTMQEIVEPSQNHKVLRLRLSDHVPPCLPFLGMYLTDLTFVDIGNPATKHMSLGSEAVETGSSGLTVVNFDKHCRTAKIIGELQRFQIPYRLLDVPEMQDWLSAQIQRIHEGDEGNVQVNYYRKSLLLEPRESSQQRREQEPPTPISSGSGTTRTDLFGWMSRDRGGQTPTPA